MKPKKSTKPPMREITFEIPKPSGITKENSYRPRKGGGFYRDSRILKQEQVIGLCAKVAMDEAGLEPFTNAVEMEIEIHNKNKRWVVTVKEMPYKHNQSRRYDISNIKMVPDALQKICFMNDIQVSHLVVREVW